MVDLAPLVRSARTGEPRVVWVRALLPGQPCQVDLDANLLSLLIGFDSRTGLCLSVKKVITIWLEMRIHTGLDTVTAN